MFKSERDFYEFRNEILHHRRYIHTENTLKFKDEFIRTAKEFTADIEPNTVFARAQKGCDMRPMYQEDIEIGEIETAYNPKRMKPLLNSAREGRINPKGIPYLYRNSIHLTVQR